MPHTNSSYADDYPLPSTQQVLAGTADVLRNCPTLICEVASRHATAVAELLDPYS
jgi:hypothetical protein